MDAGTWAAWFGAVGTIGAVFVAIWLPQRERQHDAKIRKEEDEEREEEKAKKDLDETRLLLYIALLHARTGLGVPPQLAGTIVHALSEHSHRLGAEEAFILGREMVAGFTNQPRVCDLIDEICLLRGDDLPDWHLDGEGL